MVFCSKGDPTTKTKYTLKQVAKPAISLYVGCYRFPILQLASTRIKNISNIKTCPLKLKDYLIQNLYYYLALYILGTAQIL